MPRAMERDLVLNDFIVDGTFCIPQKFVKHYCFSLHGGEEMLKEDCIVIKSLWICIPWDVLNESLL